jgi:hypothetical protein
MRFIVFIAGPFAAYPCTAEVAGVGDETMKMLRILSLLVLATGSWSYTDVHIVVFLSLHTVYNVTSYLPGASLAFKVANNRTDLLQGHRLMYTFRNVDCSALRAIRQVVETLEEETQFIMAIGADCSRSSRALAAVTQHYNLVQVSVPETHTSPVPTRLDYLQ